MKSSLINSIGEVVTDYGARVMKVFKKGLLGRSLFDFYGDIKADALRTNESSAAPGTPADGKGGVIYTKSADGKLYYKSNEVAEVELSANGGHTDEDIEDIAGNLVATGGTKTGIAITYDDANGDMDFVVDHDAATNFVAEEHYRWDNDIQSTATINHLNLSSDTPGETEVLVMNDGDAVWGHGEKIHIQVRNDEGSTISAGAPLYSKGEIGGSNRILVGVCDANDSAKMPCIGIAHSEMNTTSTKDNFAVVSGIYNTNISGFTSLAVGHNLYIQNDGSLSQTKPTGEDSLIQNVGIVLKTNGTICQGLLVSAIGRTNDVPNLDQNAIFLGNGSNQSVATDAPMVGVITAANAGAARTVLGVDAAGTDNSTNVTLAGTPDYITISGQEITRNAIDLTADVTGTLSVANGGTGATSLTANSILTGDGTNAIVAEPKLTYSGEILSIGEADAGDATITKNNGAGTNGGGLIIQSGRGSGGTNLTGGDLTLRGGPGTGNGASGNIVFSAGVPGSSGTGVQSVQEIGTLDSTGNLSIDGDLTVKGNDIKDDDGTTCITFDSSGNTTIANTLNASVTGNVTGNTSGSSGSCTGNAATATALTSGNKTIDGDLTVNGDVAIGNDAEITSVGSMVFRIDSDADESSQKFTWKNNASDVIAEINEADELVIYGSSSGDPRILLHQTGQNNTYGPPQLDFYREDTLVDNADLGMINFIAKDSADNDQTYAKIIGHAEESGSGTEGGKIKLQVATHDGEIQTGVLIEDGDAEDEVDVTIANGSDSLTTVSGKLAVGGDLTGVTNFIDVKTAAYWSSSTSAIYVPISGATTSEATSLATSSYTTMFVVPFDGKVTRITSWNQGTASPATSTFELYINGDDDPLSDQVGTDLVLTSYNNSMVGDCASDWVFTKGQTIAIRRTDSNALYGVTMSVVLEYDTTT